MTNEQMKEFVELCKNEIIQSYSSDEWLTVCDYPFCKRPNCTLECQYFENKFRIPHLGQLVEILGERFLSLTQEENDRPHCQFRCRFRVSEDYLKQEVLGQTPEIACANAIIFINSSTPNLGG